MRIAAMFLLTGVLAPAQSSEDATLERHGNFATLSAHTSRPMDAFAIALESNFGIVAGSEDPLFQFKEDMMDISKEIFKVRAGTLVPARWSLLVEFPIDAAGKPVNVPEFMQQILTAANTQSPFTYRLDHDGDAYTFVPTRIRDAQGRQTAVTPLLDLPVTIPPGTRPIHESASLMAQDLSRQTGLRVSCCQSFVAGIPWGMPKLFFAAENEPARSVLRRLGLSHWHMRCDTQYCFIDINADLRRSINTAH